MKFKQILKEAYKVDNDSPRFGAISNNSITKKDFGKWSGSLEELEKINALLDRFNNGKVYIEFASSPEPGKKHNVKLIVKFEGDTSWLMNHKNQDLQNLKVLKNFYGQ